MNNKLLSFAAAAATLLAFAACNKDDAPKPDVVTPEMANAYAKVAISMPKVTRADVTFGDGGYDAGNEAEQKITDIFLAFYDSFGNYVGKGEMISEILSSKNGQSDNISNIHTQIFKLSLTEDANEPTQVIAFINTPLVTVKLDNLTTTSDGTAKVEASEIMNDEKGFAMTNSGYFESDGKYVAASKLEVALYESEEAAKGGSTNATIYVERLASKITVKEKDGGMQEDLNYKVVDIDGKSVSLKFTPSEWAPTGTAKEENLVKTQFEKEEDWMASTYRSYWAQGVNYNLDFVNYYDKQQTKPTAKSPLNYVEFSQVGSLYELGETPQYVPEHTSKLQMGVDENNLPTGMENIIANTYALVIGKYSVETEGSYEYKNEDDETDFFLLLTGENKDGLKTYTIYNTNQLIALLLKYNGITEVYNDADKSGKVDEEDYSDHFGLNYNSKGQYILVFTEELYDQSGNKITLGEDQIATKSRHYYFENGAAYFNVPIATNTDDGGVTTYGVVRNHSYVLTLSKITNLGAPLNGDVFDSTDDPIIPNPDELKDHFIKAEINVLSWHVVNNGVTL